MSISTLVLYGSCARQDNSAESDVDLFSIGTNDDYRMIVTNKVNLAVYPKDIAFEMSKSGDLFMLHLVREGRPIYDEQLLFRKMADLFKFKSSYEKEISNAADLGWALLALSTHTKNWTLLNKRMAWCVRTILIASAANEKKAIFSAADLFHYSNDKSVLKIIKNKEQQKKTEDIFSSFEIFLEKHSKKPLEFTKKSTPEYFLKKFSEKKNTFGEKTIKTLLGKEISELYT